jgi:hypothetical protein
MDRQRKGKNFNKKQSNTCCICEKTLTKKETPDQMCTDCYIDIEERKDYNKHLNDELQWEEWDEWEDRASSDESWAKYVNENVCPQGKKFVYVTKPYHENEEESYCMFYSSCSYCGNKEEQCDCEMCDVCDMIQQCCHCE